MNLVDPDKFASTLEFIATSDLFRVHILDHTAAPLEAEAALDAFTALFKTWPSQVQREMCDILAGLLSGTDNIARHSSGFCAACYVNDAATALAASGAFFSLLTAQTALETRQ